MNLCSENSVKIFDSKKFSDIVTLLSSDILLTTMSSPLKAKQCNLSTSKKTAVHLHMTNWHTSFSEVGNRVKRGSLCVGNKFLISEEFNRFVISTESVWSISPKILALAVNCNFVKCKELYLSGCNCLQILQHCNQIQVCENEDPCPLSSGGSLELL